MKKLIWLFFLALTLATAGLARAGGPVVLMGIDAEDGGPGGHGPISVYQTTAQSILTSVTKPAASGILVIGGVGGSQVQTFWNALGSGLVPAVPVTFVNGSAISTVNFASFALIGVASDSFNTSGGLTDTENGFLAARASDIAAHINSGGGLLGFSNCALTGPYAYLGSVGSITCASAGYSDITPTAQGLTIGITDALDVCCWHDQYATFPSFLNVLANVAGTTLVAAIGGAEVVIPGFVLTPATATNLVGTTHTVTIEVTQTVGGAASPIAGIVVSFAVSGVNTATGACQTDVTGKCTFTYTGANVGIDAITATATVLGQAQTAQVAKTWTTPPYVELPFDIKPTSCRNPLHAKVNETAVLPAAILGFTNLDVTLVNPASVRLEGVPAIRWALEDVATPFVPFTGKRLATDCTTSGPDGFLDLSLKFNNQMIINALGGPAALADGQVVILHMTGSLHDGTAIVGEDVVVIIKKK